MYNCLGTIQACDRRTDILPWHSPRYAYASRDKNNGITQKWRCPILHLSVITYHSFQLQSMTSYWIPIYVSFSDGRS